MSLQNRKLLLGAALLLMADLGVIAPVFASSSAKQLNQQFISQAAVPRRSSETPVADVEVHGRIVKIDGERVQIRREDGKLASYNIPEFDQRRFELAVGSDVTLTVRAADNVVAAIRNVSQTSAPGNTDRIPVADVEVHGRIVKIDGERVQIRREDGKLASYNIPEFDQRRFELAVGSDVTLTVRAADNVVAAIRNVSQTSAPGNR